MASRKPNPITLAVMNYKRAVDALYCDEIREGWQQITMSDLDAKVDA